MMLQKHKGILRQPTILLSVLLVLGACTSVSDLTFVSLRVTSVENLTPEIRKNVQIYNKETKRLLELSFSTEEDLIKIGKRYANLVHNISICSEENSIEANKGVGVSLYMARENEVFGSTSQPAPLEKSGEISATTGATYKAYFDISRPTYTGRLLTGLPQPFSFDLRTNPQDVCFQVVGGDMWTGMGFTSNILVIPKEAIASALAQTK